MLRIAIGIVWRDRRDVGEGPQVLVARRLYTAAHAAGLREFPGGKVEEGEAPQQCVAREVREETGLQVLVGAPYSLIRWTYPEREVELLAFDCTVIAGQAQAIESKEIVWIAPHQLEPEEFPAANASLIAEIKSRHVKG